MVSGTTGTNKPSNVDDYYAPDINSNIVPLPGVLAANGFDCSTLSNNGNDWTTDFDSVKCNDQLKVNAVLNWINGRTHLGNLGGQVPIVFGMDFQAVSVGEKLVIGTRKGGYMDAAGTPTTDMLNEFKYVDAAIGQMVSALKAAGLFSQTTIIITAKHGQSPIDTNRFFPIPGPSGSNGMPPSSILGPAFLPDSEINQIGSTEDDISLLWLSPGASVTNAVSLLESNATAAGLGRCGVSSTTEKV
ncbi:MAG TPA: alkaline phosphatase family protein [Bryobacteraceae bacterium]|nr:alkaline phosphatase family protein [Bryobacteraceae bacterium]